VFRAELGVSFGRWHKQLRLMHGLSRLAAGDKVTSAALEAGYSSVSAFIQAFRQHFGVTPGSYLRAPNTR
jgi:AraC-like DNA-binding protein